MDGGLGERLFKFAIDVIKYLKLLTLEIKKQENIWLMNQVSLKRSCYFHDAVLLRFKSPFGSRIFKITF